MGNIHYLNGSIKRSSKEMLLLLSLFLPF